MSAQILYIEDNPFNMRLVGKMLAMSGYEMLSAISGLDGIKAIQGNKLDLILLDMNLPDIDGLEVLSRLKEDPSFDIPVIAVTANAMYGDRERYLAAGCSAYVSKPVDRRELIEVINEFLTETTVVNQ